MELNQIKHLLEKYYDGNTSLEEEQLLKDYFRYRPVPAELETDKELFLYTSSEAKTALMHSNLEQKLDAWIDQQEPQKKTFRLNPWIYRIAGVAAVFAVVVTIYITSKPSKIELSSKDTYKDPQVAYAEAKKALMFVSQQLNRGTAPLGQMDKLNTGMKRLSTVSSLNNGLEQLQMVSRYYDNTNTEHNKTK